MIIDFPQFVEYRYFYRFLLCKLVEFANEESDHELIINLQQTDHLAPNVICDLLCFFKYVQTIEKGNRVFLSFGNSVRLSSYLDNAWFFLQSENNSLFSTDLLSYGSKEPLSKLINTSKINRIPIPQVDMQRKDHSLPIEIINQIQRQVGILFSRQKVSGMQRYGVLDPVKIATAFSEIIENSYCHCHDFRNCGCYYTFQNYKKTGLSFACSDIGIGFFDSLIHQFQSDENKKQPKVFSKAQFRGFAADNKRKHIAAIIESLVFRVGEGANVDYGFPYIIHSLVIPNNGELIIHSENTLLKIDNDFLNKFFVINNQRIVDFNKSALQSLVLSDFVLNNAISSGALRIFDYCFPGVHLSVRIEGE